MEHADASPEAEEKDPAEHVLHIAEDLAAVAVAYSPGKQKSEHDDGQPEADE